MSTDLNFRHAGESGLPVLPFVDQDLDSPLGKAVSPSFTDKNLPLNLPLQLDAKLQQTERRSLIGH